MRVAIAGGTSPTLGASLIDALLATGGRYVPVILSRGKVATWSPKMHQNGVEVRQVDYHSHASLVAALNDVEVVLSVLLIPGPDWVTAQVNLLHAAEEAGCRRFAPSEFALSAASQSKVDILKAKNEVWNEVQASVDQGRIDAARFPCGMFMNYLGIGCPDGENRVKALAGFQEGPYMIYLDRQPSWVEVPIRADGTTPSLSMTDIRDVGKFVVAALDLQEPWAGRELGFSGDTLSFDELVSLCEKHTGRAVEARRVTTDELKSRLSSVSPDEFIKRMEIQLSIVCAHDGSVVEPTLNSMSSVNPTTVDKYLQHYWGPCMDDRNDTHGAQHPF
ncbi:hypothetical protein VI817_007198 [Penicillium citrinum]|nr:hypothetical protein VI817_007198 [Penicillium citrinum]